MQEFIFEVKPAHAAARQVVGSWDDAFQATGLYLSPGRRAAIQAAAEAGGPSVNTTYGTDNATIRVIAPVIARIPVMS
jgi:hypothetical protein